MVERTGARMVMVGCLLASAGVGWELGIGWGVVTLGTLSAAFGVFGIVATWRVAMVAEYKAKNREAP